MIAIGGAASLSKDPQVFESLELAANGGSYFVTRHLPGTGPRLDRTPFGAPLGHAGSLPGS